MAEGLSGVAVRAVLRGRLARAGQRTSASQSRHAELSFFDLAQSSSRTFASTSAVRLFASPSVHAGDYQKEYSRQRRHDRDALRSKRSEGREEKDPYSRRNAPSRGEIARDPEREELDAQIQAYMAATGPNGERLTFKQKETLLRTELGRLDKELDRVEKKKEADAATAHLPPLDDNVLGEIYQALKVPPPPSGEESRLARLASGRRERKLLPESIRGRRQPDMPALSWLPPTVAEKSRHKVSRSLNQKLIDATMRSRLLLPPIPRRQLEGTQQTKPAAEELKMHLEEETEEVSLSALPREERQEIRLQQLFARLAVVPPTTQGEDTLQDLKSSLAERIANTLRSREQQLPTPPPSEESGEMEPMATPELSSEFDPLRLDVSASIMDAVSAVPAPASDSEEVLPADAQLQHQLLTKAEAMLSDLDSSESRDFMLDRIERLLPSTDATSADKGDTADSTPPSEARRLPLGIASPEEWSALAVSSAKAGDWTSLTRTMTLMERAGYFPPPLALYNNLLDVFATKGDVSSCLQILSSLTASRYAPDDYTYHSLTKVYVETAQFARAIELLNSLELQSRPAAMATYTLLISKLVAYTDSSNGGRPRPEVQALAWSVYQHMRLVAHPVPDAPLYALMIRACAKGIPQPIDIDDPSKMYSSLDKDTALKSGSGFDSDTQPISEAERALDLFREMTTRYGVRPNAEVYNSLILACARRKDFYLEAFRLLREMVGLESERVDLPSGGSAGVLRFAPDRYTFNALLQGCAKKRDLARARWVLAEMIRTTLPLFDDAVRPQLSRAQTVEMLAKRPNEETLCHLFHTYASFAPTVRRQEMKLQQSMNSHPGAHKAAQQSSSQSSSVEISDPARDLTNSTTDERQSSVVAQHNDYTTADEAAHVFSALVPRTSADVLSEARSLFARVLADQPQNGVEGPLGAVTPGIRLVNTYMSVLAAHLEDNVKGRIMSSMLLGDARAALLEKGALVLQSGGDQDMFNHERTLEDSLIARLGLVANEHTYKILLQSFSVIPTKTEQETFELAEQVQTIWTMFTQYVDSNEGKHRVLDAKCIKLCWTSYIRFWAKHAELHVPEVGATGSIVDEPDRTSALPGLDKAMDLLRDFVARYPPRPPQKRAAGDSVPTQHSLIHGPIVTKPKPTDATGKMLANLDLSPFPVPQKSLESLRVLTQTGGGSASRPTSSGVNTSENAHAKDRPVDKGDGSELASQTLPTLTFTDVELLHHRLVRYARVKDVAYLTWLLSRSAAASRPRKTRPPTPYPSFTI